MYSYNIIYIIFVHFWLQTEIGQECTDIITHSKWKCLGRGMLVEYEISALQPHFLEKAISLASHQNC